MNDMVVVTGAAGFIGSCVVARLNAEGLKALVLVDDFSRPDKRCNYQTKSFLELVNRSEFLTWARGKERRLKLIIHLGARTDTLETNRSIFDQLNVGYSQAVWRLCAESRIPLIYASSAATYGLGERGYADDHELVPFLKPLNPYGESKQEFDLWVLQQASQPPAWVGLKFFNVYGPNEYHKGPMASVVLQAFRQIMTVGRLRLFRSHHADYADGDQCRDFIYVKDVANIVWHFMTHAVMSGIYNVGTGVARSFNDLAASLFKGLHQPREISYFDMPSHIQGRYQYRTQAEIRKLCASGYTGRFWSLEEGIDDYVKDYLLVGQRYM